MATAAISQELVSLKSLPEVMEVSGPALPQNAAFMKVDSHETCELANSYILQAKGFIKEVDDRLDKKRETAYRAYQGWLELIKELKAPYIKIVNALDPRVSAYVLEVKRKQEEEKARETKRLLEEEKRRREEEEKQKLAEAEILEEAGQHEEADQLVSEIIQKKEEPMAFKANPITPKVNMTGASIRTYWHAEVFNLTQLIQAASKDKRFEVYLQANMSALNNEADKFKRVDIGVPGARGVSTHKTAATGR